MLRRARSVKGSHIDIASVILLSYKLYPPARSFAASEAEPASTGPPTPILTEGLPYGLRNLAGMPTVEQVREALVEVKDPELNLGILELGLVYDITAEGENGEDVSVMMTLTSPMCPVGPMFVQSVKDHVMALDGVKNANVEITFTPPWDPKTMASDDVKAMLGIW
jgi:metal-sulfur cluster biosynthetic enzyme